MSKTRQFAEHELQILVSSAPENNRPIVEEFIPEILALVDKFGKSGQPGGSAPYVASALATTIKSLCLHKPICPITGNDSEWTKVSDDTNPSHTFQNNRCSALFKEGDKCHYLRAIVWRSPNGGFWGGTALLPDGTKVLSRQYVKAFPFEPKTFTIEVTEKEVSPDDFEFYVKDPRQLEEVFAYYNPFPAS